MKYPNFLLKCTVYSAAVLSLFFLNNTSFAQNEYDGSIDIFPEHTLGEVYNFWSVKNFTSQDMFTRQEMREELRISNPYMQYVNTVRLIGGRSDGKNEFYKGQDENGNPVCDFALLLEYIQGILDWGYTPRIVLDNVPNAMSSGKEFHTYGNTYPPDDYYIYQEYLKKLVTALVDEFGYREVSGWRFRAGTEPDLYPGHWAGTKEEYLKLYDFAVHAVTSVIPDADIGPGNPLPPWKYFRERMPRWGLDIIDHAALGTNYFTGAKGTRLRFFSCSWYDRVGRQGSVQTLEESVRLIRQRLNRYPQFRNIPVEIAEFMILQDVEGKRLWAGDITEWGASWFASVTDRVYRLNIAQVHLWATTTYGVLFPQTHIISFLEKMAGGQRVEAVVKNRDPSDIGATACKKDKSLYLILYNHHQDREVDKTHTLRLGIQDSRFATEKKWLMDEWLIDRSHGVFIRQLYEDCRQKGISPLEDAAEYDGSINRIFGSNGVTHFKAEIERYRELSNNIPVKSKSPVVIDGDEIKLQVSLPVHSVRMFHVYPAGE